MKVEEFNAIREWGQQNKIHVWLAGGSAAGIAHYIKSELEQEWLEQNNLPLKYFKDRFSYLYFDIFRSTQDADIVIDGKEEQALKLEEFLRLKYPYLQGSKDIWEVRLLQKSRGTGVGKKDALIGNPDFLNQNSDSHSTGMIELSEPKIDDSRVRDLFDWQNQKDPPFLNDVLNGELHFYRNPLHQTTQRYKIGINPEILSVIRYYTKAFQYGLEMKLEDKARLQDIIDQFKPTNKKNLSGSYLVNQIKKNGLKLFWHSQDVEKSWNVLDETGLRKKLIQFGKASGKDDLAICLDREPLRTFEVGSGHGKTAEELGIKIVAHETIDYRAYENITKSPTGKVNVFISRGEGKNEEATYGDGFYTKRGQNGARDTGFTIRYDVNPNAREGKDFMIEKNSSTIDDNSFIIWKNAAALKTINENISLTPLNFFQLLIKNKFLKSDLGLLERFKFKVKTSLAKLSKQEMNKISKTITKDLEKNGVTMATTTWLGYEFANQYPDIVSKAFQSNQQLVMHTNAFMSHPNRNKWLKSLLTESFSGLPALDEVLDVIFDPRIIKNSKWVETVDLVLSAGNRIQSNSKIRTERYLIPLTLENYPIVSKAPSFDAWMTDRMKDGSAQQSAEEVLLFESKEIRQNSNWNFWINLYFKKIFIFYPNFLLKENIFNDPLWPQWYKQAIVNDVSSFVSMLAVSSVQSRADWNELLEYSIQKAPKSVVTVLLSDEEFMQTAQWEETFLRTVSAISKRKTKFVIDTGYASISDYMNLLLEMAEKKRPLNKIKLICKSKKPNYKQVLKYFKSSSTKNCLEFMKIKH